MGKRELVLIVAFVIVGAVIYQATAPPPKPGQEGFAFSRIWRQMRAEIESDATSVVTFARASAAAPSSIKQIRARELRGAVTIEGEDRPDVAAELKVTTYGPDPGAAEAVGRQFTVALRETEDALDLVIIPPEGVRRYSTEVSLKVPRRLAVQLEATTGPVAIGHVAQVQMNVLRSETTVTGVKGEIRGEQRDGSLRITDAGSVRLVTRRTDLQLERIEGESSLEVTDGDVEARSIAAPLRIDGRRAEITLADVAAVQVVNTDGQIRVERPRAAVKIESLRADVEVRLEAPVPVEVTCTDAPIQLTLPPSGGIVLDARATGGEIRMQAGALAVTGDQSEKRAQGPINGGGPTVRLRASDGSITIRK